MSFALPEVYAVDVYSYLGRGTGETDPATMCSMDLFEIAWVYSTLTPRELERHAATLDSVYGVSS